MMTASSRSLPTVSRHVDSIGVPMRLASIACLSLLLMSGAALAADGSSTEAWTQWLEDLGRPIWSGGPRYEVTQGGVLEVDDSVCPQIVAVFGTCFGNNAAAPYIVPEPPIDGTYVDPYYATPFTTPGVTGAPSNMIYRLAPTDALVTVVELPPQAAYLGYQSYLFSREISDYPTKVRGQVVSPDPDRYEIFGSVGNDMNNVILGQQLGQVWNGGAAVYITTANERLADILVARAGKRGLDTDRIIVEPLGKLVDPGTGPQSDDFITLIRYALPKNADAAETWMGNLAANVQTFRVSAPPTSAVKRFATPSYTPKEPTSEARLKASQRELALLLRRWLREQEGPGVLVEPMITSDHVNGKGEPYGLVGQDCIAQGTSCVGDNQDTDAYRIAVVGRMGDTQTTFVAGVNHTRTDNASYVSLAIYDMADFTGAASASQSNPRAVGFNRGTLSGSAARVLKAIGKYGAASAALKADLPLLYVSAVSRKCRPALGTDCVTISAADLPPSSFVSITQRAYVKPGTTTGADPDVMLTPIAVFRPRF